MEYLLNMDDLGAPPFQETSICWKRDWNMLHDECRDETDGLGADRHDENMKQLSNPFISMSDFLETIENHPKPYAIKAICLHDWWRREPGHDDTMTRWHDDNNNSSSNNNNNNTNTSNSNSSSSTTAPTVPRWQPWRSTSCWWCRKRRQERRSPLGHKSGWMDDDDGWLNDAEWFWMEEGTGRWKKREVKGISSLGTGLQWYAWYRLIARFEISKKSCCPFTTKVLDVMDLLRSKRGEASCLNGIPTRLQRQRLQKWPEARC